MATIVNFTKETLSSLPIPEKGRTYYKDAKGEGLSLYVTSNGVKTFFIRKRIKGKDERIILGQYPDVSIAKARSAALVARAEVAEGKNPNEERYKLRHDSTFKQLFDRYIEDHAKVHTKSWKHDIEDVNRNLSHWFNRKSSTISTEEIRKLHATFGEKRGKYGANRLLDRINAIFNKAIEWGWAGENPAKPIKKFRMQSRNRFIKPHEFPYLFEALGKEPSETARDYILISLYTGARKSNVLAMRWSEIDFHRAIWEIPETKNGEPIAIALVKEAVEILQRRKVASKNKWVFQSDRGDGHLNDPKKAWKRIVLHATLSVWNRTPELSPLLKEAEKNFKSVPTDKQLYEAVHKLAEAKQIELPAGLLDIRLHDLRRTLGSFQAAAGANSYIIAGSLGHKDQRATAVYARYDLNPVRDSVQTAVSAMQAAANAIHKN